MRSIVEKLKKQQIFADIHWSFFLIIFFLSSNCSADYFVNTKADAAVFNFIHVTQI